MKLLRRKLTRRERAMLAGANVIFLAVGAWLNFAEGNAIVAAFCTFIAGFATYSAIDYWTFQGLNEKFKEHLAEIEQLLDHVRDLNDEAQERLSRPALTPGDARPKVH